MDGNLTLRKLLVSVFDLFVARRLGANGRITIGNSLEAEQLENEFRGLTWHNLISYHHRWDSSLSSSAFLTDEAFLNVLPSYLCACVVWMRVEADVVARILLAPLIAKEARDHHLLRFRYVHKSLSAEQRAIVWEFLLAMATEHAFDFEQSFRGDPEGLPAAIDRIWIKSVNGI
jgi:hypothetical protein